jgi:autotransporter-associated beta strand protein
MKNNILNTVRSYKFAIVALTAISLLGWSSESNAQFSLTTSTYTQNFDGLGTATSSALAGGSLGLLNPNLNGWYFLETGTSANTIFTAGTGSLATADTYSVGTAGGTDRSLGSLQSGTVVPSFGFWFQNNTGSTISGIDLLYKGETWRIGTANRTDALNFATSTSATTLSSGTWTGVSSLNYVNASAAATANGSKLQSSTISGNLGALSLANGSGMFLRWSSSDASGSDDLLAINDFSLTATLLQIAASYTWTGTGLAGTWQNGQSGDFGKTYSNATDNAVTFSGTSGDVTVSGAVQAGSLTFSTGGYALNSGNLTVGLGAITTDTGSTTINSVLEGAAGLIKSGAGTLVLTGANTLAGAVTITGGTLQIGSDGTLGNTDNDIVNNGTLKTTSNIALSSGRDITGSGTLDIAGGTTLTANGNINATATTLANSGTLDLQGATRSVGSLTVNAAGTVNGSGAINATGLTTELTSGTASINTGIVFTSGDKTLNVTSGGTLDLNGALSNGGVTGRIAKTGAGTLILSADNTMGGIRIGAAGSTMTDGGKVILESNVVGSEAQAIQLNFGTLEASTALVINKGLSIGGRSTGAASLAGGDMEFQGQSTFFRAGGTSGQFAVNVNNNTTLSGGLGATSGAGTATGVTLGGTGTLNINGNSSTFTDTITTADTVKLVVNNTLGAGVNVGSGSLLSGSGKVGAISGAGTVGPGNSPGILTATSVNPNAGTDFKFEFTALNPTYTSATASGNDLLHLTASSSPFAGGTFTSGNIISIYLNNATITNSLLAGTNTTFSGGFFVDGTYGLAAALSPASFAYYTTSASLGTGSAVDYNGTSYYSLNGDIAAKTTLSDTTVTSAGFTTGTVATGTLLTFNAVPEPSAQSMLAVGMAALVAVRAFRRNREDS